MSTTEEQAEPISGTKEEQDVPEIESPFKKLTLEDEPKRSRKLTDRNAISGRPIKEPF